jgi:chromosome segregation ATPase
MVSFAVMTFGVLGWVWASLEGRMAACEQRLSAAQQQTAVLDARLHNIEELLKEVRADVKAMRGRRQETCGAVSLMRACVDDAEGRAARATQRSVKPSSRPVGTKAQ